MENKTALKTLKFDTVETPMSRKNLGNSLGCVRCRAKVNEKKAKWVHVIAGGGEVLHPSDEKNYVADGGDLGGYPVGPECAKFFGEFAK